MFRGGVDPVSLRVAARYAKRELDLAHWDLEGLTEGRPVTLYHGSTTLFRKFDMAHSRADLVDKFYGSGIFLTPSKRVAWSYAEANRNIGFPKEIIAKLRRKNKGAGELLQAIYDHGQEKGWDTWAQESGVIQEDGHWDNDILEQNLKGIDGNNLTDIAAYIIGSKVKTDDGGGFVNIFNQSTGLPGYVYDALDEVGLDSKAYRPKVYTVTVSVKSTLVTASKSEAKRARTKGYDCVVYHGSDLVEGVPEVVVFSPQNARVKRIEVD